MIFDRLWLSRHDVTSTVTLPPEDMLTRYTVMHRNGFLCARTNYYYYYYSHSNNPRVPPPSPFELRSLFNWQHETSIPLLACVLL